MNQSNSRSSSAKRRLILTIRILPIFLAGLTVAYLVFKEGETPLHSSATAVRQTIPQAESNPVSLGDSEFTLRAFALRIRGRPEATVWRDPESLEPVAPQQLLDEGASTPSLRIDEWIDAPVLALLIEAGGDLKFVHAVEPEIFDARTGSKVSFPTDKIETETCLGSWTTVRTRLGIWHDTPLVVAVDVAHEPLDSLTVDPDEWRSWRRKAHSFQMAREHVANQSDPDVKGVGVFLQGGSSCAWFPDAANSKRETFLEWMRKEGFERVELLRYRKTSVVRFKIAGLPDMPNGREIENLFEVRIPKISTEERARIAARAVELDLKVKKWPVRSRNKLTNWENYENVSPYELLESHSEKLHPPASFRVARDGRTLIEEPRKPDFLERVSAWWGDLFD